jgi:hypothetical protein
MKKRVLIAALASAAVGSLAATMWVWRPAQPPSDPVRPSIIFTAGEATAVDYDGIERGLAKEPVYQGKPEYCLLVFGLEAKTRVWLVIDGDRAYLDRNANGDLTEDGETLEIGRGQEEARRSKLGAITPVAGEETYRLLYLDRGMLGIEVREGFDQHAALSYADRPQGAPVYHFNGPLRLWVGAPQDLEGGLVRGGPSRMFPRVALGTLVCDKAGKCLTAVGVVSDPSYPRAELRLPSRGLPKDINPVADIEYPGKQTGDPPVKAACPLDRRC